MLLPCIEVTPGSGQRPQLPGQLSCSALGLSCVNFSQCGVEGFLWCFWFFFSSLRREEQGLLMREGLTGHKTLP